MASRSFTLSQMSGRTPFGLISNVWFPLTRWLEIALMLHVFGTSLCSLVESTRLMPIHNGWERSCIGAMRLRKYEFTTC
jgi:hypothetical protein